MLLLVDGFYLRLSKNFCVERLVDYGTGFIPSVLFKRFRTVDSYLHRSSFICNSFARLGKSLLSRGAPREFRVVAASVCKAALARV